VVDAIHDGDQLIARVEEFKIHDMSLTYSMMAKNPWSISSHPEANNSVKSVSSLSDFHATSGR
jgi:hypothetical protein